MPIKHPRSREPDPASDAMGNLFVAGIEVEGLRPFAEAFPVEYYRTLPILEREGLAVFKALKIRALKSTWQQSVRDGHVFHISDEDFTPEGARRIIQTLRDFAEVRGIPVEQSAPIPQPSPVRQRRVPEERNHVRSRLLKVLRDFLPAGIANVIACEISDTAYVQLEREKIRLKPQREALAAWFIKKFWPEKNFRAIATDSLSQKFNIVNADGKYTGYSIQISSLPPFEVQILKMQQVSGRWVSREVLCQTFNPRT